VQNTCVILEPSGVVVETPRLVLRRMTTDDAPVILALLNEPSFLEFIGDRNVRTLEQARTYLETGPLAMYAEHGHGLYLVLRRADAMPIGICGLLKRAALPYADLGFSLFPAFWRQGFAFEAASAVLVHGRDVLGIDPILAIAQEDNVASHRLLEKLGLARRGRVDIPSSPAQPAAESRAEPAETLVLYSTAVGSSA
jgi:RimJ/RimL family protein N-acetyltransferase